jgi:hypothetical protein
MRTICELALPPEQCRSSGTGWTRLGYVAAYRRLGTVRALMHEFAIEKVVALDCPIIKNTIMIILQQKIMSPLLPRVSIMLETPYYRYP